MLLKVGVDPRDTTSCEYQYVYKKRYFRPSSVWGCGHTSMLTIRSFTFRQQHFKPTVPLCSSSAVWKLWLSGWLPTDSNWIWWKPTLWGARHNGASISCAPKHWRSAARQSSHPVQCVTLEWFSTQSCRSVLMSTSLSAAAFISSAALRVLSELSALNWCPLASFTLATALVYAETNCPKTWWFLSLITVYDVI